MEAREYDLVMKIESAEEAGFYLQFENSVLIAIGGESVEWLPEGPLTVDLLQRIVEEIAVWKSGRIEVVLSDGVMVSDAHQHYESWTLFTPEQHFICLAGGELAIFPLLQPSCNRSIPNSRYASLRVFTNRPSGNPPSLPS